MYEKYPNSHICPPLSEMVNITKKVDANISKYAPTYYLLSAFNKKELVYAVSLCP